MNVDLVSSAGETRQNLYLRQCLSLRALDLSEPEIGFLRKKGQELCHSALAIVDCLPRLGSLTVAKFDRR